MPDVGLAAVAQHEIGRVDLPHGGDGVGRDVVQVNGAELLVVLLLEDGLQLLGLLAPDLGDLVRLDLALSGADASAETVHLHAGGAHGGEARHEGLCALPGKALDRLLTVQAREVGVVLRDGVQDLLEPIRHPVLLRLKAL